MLGGDSAIELASALVVLWRFSSSAAQEQAERRAAQITGLLLFALATLVVAASVTALLGYVEPKPTFLGIAVLLAAAVCMPSACEGETAAISGNGQRSPQSGRRRVSDLRLSLVDRVIGVVS